MSASIFLEVSFRTVPKSILCVSSATNTLIQQMASGWGKAFLGFRSYYQIASSIQNNPCTTIWILSDFHGCSDESKPPKLIVLYIYICYMSTCIYIHIHMYIIYIYIYIYIQYIHTYIHNTWHTYIYIIYNTHIHIISSLCWHRSTTSMSSWGQDQFDVWPNHLGHTIPTERSRHLSERNKKWVKQKKAKKKTTLFFLQKRQD